MGKDTSEYSLGYLWFEKTFSVSLYNFIFGKENERPFISVVLNSREKVLENVDCQISQRLGANSFLGSVLESLGQVWEGP